MTELRRLAVLASGSGSNLQAILDAAAAREIPAEVRVVLSDREDAYALERARSAGVEALHLSPRAFATRETFDAAVLELLRARKIDWVILAGFMRILSPLFVRAYAGRILNIHPALLPKYPGTHAIERALAAGERETGVTVHFVDEGVDTGPLLMQERLEIRPGESLDELTERVHALEHLVYPEAIRRALKDPRR
jgi:phosphoribosylglycinamide formyltransferase-1